MTDTTSTPSTTSTTPARPSGYEQAIAAIARMAAIVRPERHDAESPAYERAWARAVATMTTAGADEDEAMEWADSAIADAQARADATSR